MAGVDPDEEITVPAKPETTAQIAAQWYEDIAFCERPTRDIRRPSVQANFKKDVDD
jgi:hypothetical protein